MTPTNQTGSAYEVAYVRARTGRVAHAQVSFRVPELADSYSAHSGEYPPRAPYVLCSRSLAARARDALASDATPAPEGLRRCSTCGWILDRLDEIVEEYRLGSLWEEVAGLRVLAYEGAVDLWDGETHPDRFYTGMEPAEAEDLAAALFRAARQARAHQTLSRGS